MEEKVDIVALEELLIDFTEARHSRDGRKLFEQNPGGAPANLLTVASHFGYHTSFIGKVGNDMHGKFLKKQKRDISLYIRGRREYLLTGKERCFEKKI